MNQNLRPMNESWKVLFVVISVIMLCSTGAFGISDKDIGDPYGVCVHIHTWEHPWAAAELKIWKEMGVTKYRSGMPWQDVQTPHGVWVWENVYDKTAKLMAEHPEFKLVDVFGGLVPGGKVINKEHLDAYLNFITAQLDRDPGQTFGAFQILNETNINGVSAAEYADIFRAAAKMLRKRYPKVPVVAAGTSGVPLDYIEQEFQAGLAKDMDVFAVHPYGWHRAPENWIPAHARAVRRLMTKYGAGNKPLWFTEVGYSTEYVTNFPIRVYPRLLKEMGLKAETTRAYVLFDPEYNLYSETHIFNVREHLPGIDEIIPIRTRDLATLRPSENDLLILPNSQLFPARHVKDLKGYLARGGKVFSPQVFVCFSELTKEADGVISTKATWDAIPSALHMAWDYPKGKGGSGWNWQWADPNEQTALPEKYASFTFFGGANLAKGDRFTPILYNVNGELKGAVAGVYHLNSDLKGKIAVAALPIRGCSEFYQAYLNTRTLILAISESVAEIYIHHFRALEGERFSIEHHFGICHSNLDPKPAQCALRTLIQELPPHSTRPVISKVEDAFVANWTQPNGQKVTAVWRASIRTAPMTFVAQGKVTARECTGVKIPVSPKNGVMMLEIGPGVTYIRHEGDLKIQVQPDAYTRLPGRK